MTYYNGLGHWASIEKTKKDGKTWYRLNIDNGHDLTCSYYETKDEAIIHLRDLICWEEVEEED